MRPSRRVVDSAINIGIFLVLLTVVGGIIFGINWIDNKDDRDDQEETNQQWKDFSDFCGKLDAEAESSTVGDTTDWVCIKDKEIVYQ